MRLRLTTALVLVVLAVTAVGMILDYRREYRIHMDELRAWLMGQAQALRVARKQIKQPSQFAEYVDEFCAQMNEYISPGHHILVLGGRGEILASTRHHSGPAVEKILLAADGKRTVLKAPGHKLAQVRLKDDDGATIIVAQYLDHVEGILRQQLVSRTATAAATAVAIIVLVFLAIHFWSIRPMERLAEIAGEWSTRAFSARAHLTGPSEIRLLSSKFNAMAEELERHEHRRIAELERARRIQANLLPTSLPSLPGLIVATEYHPVGHVAGDLYDIFALPDNGTAFVVLDVAGHGISAALLTGVVKMSLHRRLAEQADPGKAISLVNGDLLACISGGEFVTACVGIWRPKDSTWTYCGAGHPGGLLAAGEEVQYLPPTGPLLGVLPEAEWLSETIQLHPTNRIFLYSDGATEAGMPSNKLGQAGLERITRRSSDKSLADQVAFIMNEVSIRSSGEPEDDVTVIAIEFSPGHQGQA